MNVNEKRRRALMFVLGERECPNCREYFQPTDMGHTFCTKKCGGEYYSTNSFPKSKKFEYLKQSDGSYKCPYCERTFTIYGLHPHIWRNHTEKGKKFVPSGCSNPWSKGLTKETDDRIRKAAEKRKGNNHWLGKKHTEETKKKIGKRTRDWFKNGGTNPNAGRSKKYHHDSPIVGHVVLDGTWELRTAIFFDGSELNWRKNTKGFKYLNPKTNEPSIYIPDFYVYDWKTYVEVKGYISKVDKAKWAYFPEPLEVWDEEKLKEYGILL